MSFGTLASLLLAAPSARAQTATVERPTLPAYSLAGDDGALSIWRNPANLGFDTDPGIGLLYTQRFPSGDEPIPADFGFVSKAGPLALGLSQRGGGNVPSWWTVSTGLAIRLDRTLTLGTHLGWQLPEGADNNITTYDLGLGWRPAPWFGAAGIVQNIGAPGAALGVDERYGAGVVLRPFGDLVRLGADYLIVSNPGGEDDGMVQGTLVLNPTNGLIIRGYGDQTGRIGAGLELYFDGLGVGGHSQLPADDPTGGNWTAYLTTGDQHLNGVTGRNKVPQITLDSGYPYQPTAGLFSPVQGESYLHLLQRIERAAADPTTKGMLVHLDAAPFSFAQIEELRSAMGRARARGKTVVAYLDRASSNRAYLIASAADRIYMHPAATLELIGLSAEQRFFRGTLDLIGVEPQVVRRAEYKSAFESFSNTEPSDASRESTNDLLDDLYGAMVQSIADGRAKSTDDISALIDKGPFTPKEAEENGLIDGVGYPDDLKEELKEAFDGRYDLDRDYYVDDTDSGWRSPREIAVVYVDGPIVTGASSTPGLFSGRSAGSDTLVDQIEAAANSSSVKALILRVDSPGGSAFASDEIWKALEDCKKRKPVIVSMGGVAASGGYWVSANATAIYASETTITGSIGVITAKMSLGELYDKIGLNYELYTRGRNAALYSTSRPWDANEMAAIDRMIGDTYQEFLAKVSDGRDMDVDEVHEVARGRVWSGKRAKEHGLVDEIGGFTEALERAKLEAGLKATAKVDLVTFSSRMGSSGAVASSGVEAVRRALGIQAQQVALPPELQLLQTYTLLREDHVLAIMPYELEIR